MSLKAVMTVCSSDCERPFVEIESQRVHAELPDDLGKAEVRDIQEVVPASGRENQLSGFFIKDHVEAAVTLESDFGFLFVSYGRKRE